MRGWWKEAVAMAAVILAMGIADRPLPAEAPPDVVVRTSPPPPAPLPTLAPPTPAPAPKPRLGNVMACIRRAETRGWANPYVAVSDSGKFRGAYQADRSFWLTYGGDPSYAGTEQDPSTWRWEQAPPAMQDAVATAGYRDRGLDPWPPAQHCGGP